jgi:hypothetical protein
LDSAFLAIDESMPLFPIERVCPADFGAEAFERRNDLLFHGSLRGLAVLVRSKPEVAAGDQVDCFHVPVPSVSRLVVADPCRVTLQKQITEFIRRILQIRTVAGNYHFAWRNSTISLTFPT